MSRSFKKIPCYRDRSPYCKNQANRTVRRFNNHDIPSGKSYKKLYESWNICDYQSFGWTHAKIRRIVCYQLRDLTICVRTVKDCYKMLLSK